MSEQSESRAVAIAPPRLPYHPAVEERFGVSLTEWRALVDAVFPLAKETSSVILALSYCRARKLDPFKKPVHIVPMWNSQLKRMVETVWPGIGELRTTAFRTGQYAGRDEAKYGETKTTKLGSVEIDYPEWCQVTVYRLLGGQRLPFPGPRVYWMESYATAARDSAEPNAMWKRRPFGQLDKCAEAASLRAAFPEEIGNEYAAEEMEGQTLIDNTNQKPALPTSTVQGIGSKLDLIAGAPASKLMIDHDPETGEVTSEETTTQIDQTKEVANDQQQQTTPQTRPSGAANKPDAEVQDRRRPAEQASTGKPDAAIEQRAAPETDAPGEDARQVPVNEPANKDGDPGAYPEDQSERASAPTAQDRERMEYEAELLSIAQTKAQKGERPLKLWLGSLEDSQLEVLKRLEKQIAAYLPPDQKVSWPKR